MRKYLRNIKSKLALLLNSDYFYGRKSYSQEGEDLIIEKLFRGQKNGFFVDVGAHHPFRYSNTQKLYKKGWRGINIEPTPGKIELFNKVRSRDINLGIGISNKNSSIDFYMFEDHALNTFNKKDASRVIGSGQSKLLGRKKIKVKSLSTALDNYLLKTINYLNIDVEGGEMDVLKSNNWKKYTPQVISVENLDSKKEIFKFLNDKGYKLVAKTISTEIYKHV